MTKRTPLYSNQHPRPTGRRLRSAIVLVLASAVLLLLLGTLLGGGFRVATAAPQPTPVSVSPNDRPAVIADLRHTLAAIPTPTPTLSLVPTQPLPVPEAPQNIGAGVLKPTVVFQTTP